MLLDDDELQESSDSFCYTPPYWTHEIFPRDEFDKNMVNMTKSFRIDTPELAIDDFDIDDNYENKPSNEKSLVGQLKAQLIHNQIQRTQARDYLRILHQSNKPAYWYKTPPLPRSVYFYDPKNQKYVQQQLSLPQRKPSANVHGISPKPTPVSGRVNNHSSFSPTNSFSYTPRTKNMLDLYNTSINSHQLKQRPYRNFHPPTPNVSQRYPSAQSRSSVVPILPPVKGSKQRTEQGYELLNTNEYHQPIIAEIRKKFNPIVMPPTS